MNAGNNAKLIAEYEKLRHRLTKLFGQIETTDRRLVEIERVLPDTYVYPGDRSLNHLDDRVPEIGRRERK